MQTFAFLKLWYPNIIKQWVLIFHHRTEIHVYEITLFVCNIKTIKIESVITYFLFKVHLNHYYTKEH